MDIVELLFAPRTGSEFYHLGSRYTVCSASKTSRSGAFQKYSVYAVCGGYGQYFDARAIAKA